MLKDIVARNRSYRRFHEKDGPDRPMLEELVELARLSPSGGNVQPLKYWLCSNAETNARVFPHLRWAGYLKDWDGPVEGERPGAYIVILGDKDIKTGFGCDHGIAAQSMMLGAAERGFGGCMIGSLDRDALRTTLAIPERFEILLVLALGKPAETVMIEPVGQDGDIKYYRNADGTHHVPKRALADIIVN